VAVAPAVVAPRSLRELEGAGPQRESGVELPAGGPSCADPRVGRAGRARAHQFSSRPQMPHVQPGMVRVTHLVVQSLRLGVGRNPL